ncbi:DUF6415 family natural product biosynthesis protein [Streptomyces sp. N2-109]|uniref:DUF6415 family natural product biosynthesis protein n=1 Tax=Streptomyces gossypii TaxID=2883101 RepID=A0ABT2K0I6_9ACTN|nr:DUF6415 family natural product biosynthesis protein [Streptomyces gossypii]MCT2592974.1 DUF6415 family natural product biosynthesis protein [Streptomyces gossypii]MCT2593707.1 DUF6415 family natural product biosynthesis protein [Streptomyces gossypii]
MSTAQPRAGGGVPPDAERVRALIQRALHPRAMPDGAEVAELKRELCSFVRTLLPEAEAAVDKLWYGSLIWFQRCGRLKLVRELQEQGPDVQLLTPHVYVRHLARDCRVLLEYLGLNEDQAR